MARRTIATIALETRLDIAQKAIMPAMSKVAVLGSGQVGQVLADGFLKHGYEVMRGSRDPAKLESWKSGGGAKASVGTFAESAKFGDIIVLAVKGTASESALEQAGAENIA